jgi:hypothetical protein
MTQMIEEAPLIGVNHLTNNAERELHFAHIYSEVRVRVKNVYKTTDSHPVVHYDRGPKLSLGWSAEGFTNKRVSGKFVTPLVRN